MGRGTSVATCLRDLHPGLALAELALQRDSYAPLVNEPANSAIRIGAGSDAQKMLLMGVSRAAMSMLAVSNRSCADDHAQSRARRWIQGSSLDALILSFVILLLVAIPAYHASLLREGPRRSVVALRTSEEEELK